MTTLSSLNFDLGESVDMLRDAVYHFAQAEIAPLAAETDQKNEFPNQLWLKMGEMGLLGVTVPEEYGGADMGYLAHIVAMEEISRASASVGLSFRIDLVMGQKCTGSNTKAWFSGLLNQLFNNRKICFR
jgi:isovaleryl-CoA dehydrogenase